jgi:WD40 repeat protein
MATIGALNSSVNFWSLNTLLKHYSVAVKGSFIHTFKFSPASNYELFVLTCDSKIKVYALEKSRAYLTREMVNTHENFISDLAFVGTSYLVTVGGDKAVNVWDYWFRLKKIPEARQQFKGHACPIYSVVGTPGGQLFTAGGSEGIFSWKFLGDYSPLEGLSKITFSGDVSAVLAVAFEEPDRRRAQTSQHQRLREESRRHSHRTFEG